MEPVRTLVIAAAVSVVAILSVQTSTCAAPKPTSAPLSLAPPAEEGEKPSTEQHGKVAKPTHAAARREAPPPAPVEAPTETDQRTPLQGADSVALIAQLPWWRPDEWLAARDKVASNQVLAVAQAWIGPGAVSVDPEPGNAEPSTVAQAVAADSRPDNTLAATALADPGELNEIDRRASDQSAQNGLMVMFAGALAAVFAACFLFTFRRRAFALND